MLKANPVSPFDRIARVVAPQNPPYCDALQTQQESKFLATIFYNRALEIKCLIL